MKPQKRSAVAPIVYAVCLAFVIFFALHGAIAYETVNRMYELGEISRDDQIFTFIRLFSERATYRPWDIVFNRYTKDWLTYGIFAWGIVVLSIEDNRKNYIHGKEFGDSKWGTQADIQDLFADNLMREEIKRAKEIQNPLGRWKAKSNIYKEIDKNGQMLLKSKLDELEWDELKRKRTRKTDRKSEKEAAEAYKKAVAEAKKKSKEEIRKAKEDAWLPDKLKKDYNKALKEIDAEENLYSAKEDKDKRKQVEKEKYEKALADFLDSSKKELSIRKKYRNADMLFTETEHISFYNYKLNQNTLILGGSGAGKTRGFVMPNVLQAHSSYVITDPKGEILEKSGVFLEEQGYRIRVLNLDNKAESDYYNPFKYIHPERDGYEERVLSLIETIIVNTNDGEKKGGSDPFWDNAERLFLQAIFFFTVDGFTEEEQNMNTALQLIRMLQLSEEDDQMNSDLDVFANMFAEEHGEDHIGVQQYREFREKASGKTAKSIVITAVARFAPFRASSVRRIFTADTMSLDRVGEEKTAIFVVVPPTDSTFNFIAGMLFTQLFQELQYCATQVHKHEGQRLPVPVRFILDEYANTCKIPGIVNFLAYARSFGIGITIILQSLEQIKNIHEKEWGVVVDNCNTLLYLGSISHMDTLEYMSKLVGKGTFDKKTSGKTKGREKSNSENEDVIGRELMMPDDIRRLPKEDCLFIVGGRPAFYSKKYIYENHPNYRFTSDADKKNSYHYTPAPLPVVETPEDENGPHGEKYDPITVAALAYVPVPTPNRIDDEKKVLKGLVEAGNIEPIPDDFKIVDGEDSIEDIENAYWDMVDQKNTEKKRFNSAIMLETEAFIKTNKAIQVQREENMLKIVNNIGRNWRNLSVIPDAMKVVDNGEDNSVLDNQFDSVYDFNNDFDEDFFESQASIIDDDVDGLDFSQLQIMAENSLSDEGPMAGSFS